MSIHYSSLSNNSISIGTTQSDWKFRDAEFPRLNNYEVVRFAEHIKTKRDNIIFLKQIHSNIIIDTNVHNIASDNPIEGDVLVSTNPQEIPCLYTADCAPIIIYDPETKLIAAIHGGRKGVQNQIISQTVEYLISQYHIHIPQTKIYIGPHIEKEEHTVFKHIVDIDPRYREDLPMGEHHMNNPAMLENFLTEKGLSTHDLNNMQSTRIDLRLMIADHILSCGFLNKNIDYPDLNTYHNHTFHSYRRMFPHQQWMVTYAQRH